MRYSLFSYRFAQQILENEKHRHLLDEILEVVVQCPLFIYPGKSKSNPRLDVVQQILNAYFDVKFHRNNGWEFHPLATDIVESKLKADFRKEIEGLKIHVEVQFGNMARWYSDIFKFQTAYSTNLIDIGICIIPMDELAKRIDSNVTNYQRVLRELPAADMSITHPILIIGIHPDENTTVFNISQSKFTSLTDCHKGDNKYKLVNSILSDVAIYNIGPNSPTGITPI
jgi:hypothetical protein